MKRMDLHQTDNKIVDGTIFLVASFLASELWKEIISLGLHGIGTGMSVLMAAFLGYMAKNFWLPYYFPKDGEWKAFNFLRPKKK